MRVRKAGAWWLTLCLLFTLSGSSIVSAQVPSLDQHSSLDSDGLRASPAIFESVVRPGKTVKKDFFIVHTTDRSLPVQISSRPLDPIEKSIESNKISTFNASEWIKISEPYHIFSNQERKKLTATITAPPNAEPGGHYAMISIDVVSPATDKASSGVSISSRIGILAFLIVPGPVSKDVIVEKNSVAPLFGTSEIVRFNPEFKNTGTIHVLQNSKIIIEDILGIKRTELNVPSRIILPNTIKELSVPWEDPPYIGVYKVHVEGSYGPEQAPINSDVEYLLMIRWLPILMFGLPFGLAVMLIWRTRGRWGDAIAAFKQETSRSSRRARTKHQHRTDNSSRPTRQTETNETNSNHKTKN